MHHPILKIKTVGKTAKIDHDEDRLPKRIVQRPKRDRKLPTIPVAATMGIVTATPPPPASLFCLPPLPTWLNVHTTCMCISSSGRVMAQRGK